MQITLEDIILRKSTYTPQCCNDIAYCTKHLFRTCHYTVTSTIAETTSVFFICLSLFPAYNSTYQDFAQCVMRTWNSVTERKVLTSSRQLYHDETKSKDTIVKYM